MHPTITCWQPQANWQTVAQHLVCKMVMHHTYLVHLFAGHQVPTSMGVSFHVHIQKLETNRSLRICCFLIYSFSL